MECNIRSVQMLMLEMLNEVDRICNKYKIKYFLTGGTLLGAVRNNGFIPWDDDLDIGMLYDDYKRFLKVAKKELKPNYFIQNWDEEEHFAYPFSKLMLKDSVWLEEVCKNVNISHGLFIDIFCFYPFPNETSAQKKVYRKHVYYRQILLGKNGYNTLAYKKGIKRFLYWITLLLGRFYNLSGLKAAYKRLIVFRNKKGCALYYPFGAPYSYKKVIMKKDWIENTVKVRFEDSYYPAPRAYKKYLTYMYGDYMIPPPEEGRVNYHGLIRIDLSKYGIHVDH